MKEMKKILQIVKWMVKIMIMQKILKKFMEFVRNPIDRLISGYMHLCYYGYTENDHYCFGCNKNFTCFVNMLEKRLWQIINNEPSPFKIGKELGYSYHFYPQTWHCDYYKNQHIYTYIKYDSSDKDSFTKNIAKALKKSNISNDTITFITKKIYEIRTQHVTISKNATTSYKNILYNNPLLLQKICSIYYYDFIKFGFDLPKECKN
uniref:Zn_Tnp_IS91 domain-containing protein n=2 Tax=Strongyloides stercoralis TaxID=6248 RepID=A0A0K0E6C9_STRER